MAEQNDGGPAFCAWCPRVAFRKQGRQWLCVIHYRFQSMRTTAKRKGKSVPEYADLFNLIPPDMACPACRRAMVWTQAEGAARVVTLQHNRDGSHALICLSCNTRHAALPGDSFYDLPDGHRRCPGCEQTLPVASFATDRARSSGLKTYCRECANERHNKWADANRDRLNAEQRKRRAAR